MRSADVFTADEAAEFFSKCLNEHGVENVEVSHYTEDFADVFYVHKTVGDEKLAAKVALDFDQQDTTDIAVVQKRLAMEAEQVAENFRQEMVTTFEWDGRRVDVSVYNGGWARCHECDTRVDFQRRGSVPFTEVAELSCPQPLPRDTERTVANLDGKEAILFRMYVLGHLREQCDFECRNNKNNFRDKEPVMLRQVAGD